MNGLHAVIDCAADPDLHLRVLAEKGARSLFVGGLDSVVVKAAPHLVPLTPESALLQFLQGAQGRQLSCGVVVGSDLPTMELWQHIRRFLQAIYPDGTVGLLRFYDPRVLHPLLTSATAEQLEPWFALINNWTSFFPDRALQYSAKGGVLRVTQLG